ncbi:hypothetical protein [Nocardioides sp. URHA0020]|uniref:hypothetical protein n=1 Tax=Nocardioides sp. URHA0020 TaxID=1380392 RepID=UPI0009DEFFE2|nr:hypothetical protein [Nocardioides sp. URHA0020]
MTPPRTDRRCPFWVPVLILVLTIGQLAVAEWAPGIERFADKAFGARLIAYPLMMLLVPAVWWLAVKRRRPEEPVPYGAFSLIMLGFLVDVTGNSLDLYDSLTWWDDMNHFVNWVFLLTGIGLIIGGPVRPGWARVLMVAGLGAMLAIGWELGEWYTFIRHGTELDTAYEDTLGDETLGTLGALLAGLVVQAVLRRREVATTHEEDPADPVARLSGVTGEST